MSDFIEEKYVDESGYYLEQAFNSVPSPASFESKDPTGVKSEDYKEGWNDAVALMVNNLKQAFNTSQSERFCDKCLGFIGTHDCDCRYCGTKL